MGTYYSSTSQILVCIKISWVFIKKCRFLVPSPDLLPKCLGISSGNSNVIYPQMPHGRSYFCEREPLLNRKLNADVSCCLYHYHYYYYYCFLFCQKACEPAGEREKEGKLESTPTGNGHAAISFLFLWDFWCTCTHAWYLSQGLKWPGPHPHSWPYGIQLP